MTSSPHQGEGAGEPNKEITYLEVVGQNEGVGQSACCRRSLDGIVSHMTHTDEGGFCCLGPGSLGGGKPEHREMKDQQSAVHKVFTLNQRRV